MNNFFFFHFDMIHKHIFILWCEKGLLPITRVLHVKPIKRYQNVRKTTRKIERKETIDNLAATNQQNNKMKEYKKINTNLLIAALKYFCTQNVNIDSHFLYPYYNHTLNIFQNIYKVNGMETLANWIEKMEKRRDTRNWWEWC